MSLEKVELWSYSAPWAEIWTKKVWQATVRIEFVEAVRNGEDYARLQTDGQLSV
jgi:hypothetical protein